MMVLTFTLFFFEMPVLVDGEEAFSIVVATVLPVTAGVFMAPVEAVLYACCEACQAELSHEPPVLSELSSLCDVCPVPLLPAVTFGFCVLEATVPDGVFDSDGVVDSDGTVDAG